MNDPIWCSWGASVAGPLHIKNGIPNQDSWLSCRYKWGHVVVVSDGLGSRPHSDHGSKAACLAVIEAARLYRNNRQAEVEDILRLVHACWLVKISPFPPPECSATCLFVIQMGDKLLLGRLGDGLIVACSESEKDCLLSSEDKNDSFSNYTHSLSREFRPDLWETITLEMEKYLAVVLCTDGIADDLMPEKQIVFSKELYMNYRWLTSSERKKDLRRWLHKWPVPGHSDDKTVACLFKRGYTNESIIRKVYR